ncbi:MAG: family 10 glycosylhydrolase [Ruminococcus sp.]|nr:family 10 glycosylhydrolase [Ruminococcus sp.]
MKRRLNISIILSLIILIGVITISANKTEKQNNNITRNTIATAKEEIKEKQNEEMRGLWVSYLSLDMQGEDKSFDAFKEKFEDIIDKAKELKLNTLIVQVRPFCDALYDSKIFPYSHILSEAQGISPGYDALKYMCNAAHEKNLKIQAWINPLRVKNNLSTFSLSESNPYVTNSEIGFETNSGIFLNPADIRARELIINGVKEIVMNYQIDGIQFDDYFYPEDIIDEDKSYYDKYLQSINPSSTPLTMDEWRENNINLLISETYMAIKEINKNVKFGISPQGNISNNKNIYADVKSWCEIEGYIDYICPQLYYSINNPTLSFEEALKDWKEIEFHSQIEVYIGLAAYKAGSNEDGGTWQKSSNILKEELTLLRKYGFDGFVIYEYRSLNDPDAKKEIENLRNAI